MWYKDLPKDYYNKMMDICNGRNCHSCPLGELNPCTKNVTPAMIDAVYEDLFGRQINIETEDVWQVIKNG